MGNYASLYFGDFLVDSFKNYLPILPLLMFSQSDLVIEEDEDEESEYDQIYRFITSAAHAKEKLDTRGIDITACRRFFHEMRSDKIYYTEPYLHNLNPDNPDNMEMIRRLMVVYGAQWQEKLGRGEFIDNPIDFELYLHTLKQIYFDRESFLPSVSSWLEQDRNERIITNEHFFHLDERGYYEEIHLCILLRCLLEVIPSNHSVIFDVTDLIDTYIEEEALSTIIDDNLADVRRQIEINYRIYGFVLDEDPTLDIRLRRRLTNLNEDQFIAHVLQPLLERMGYERVRKVSSHGRNEFGSDILPFRSRTPLGTIEYYALQAKAVDIHGTSARPGNAGELIAQTLQAFKVTFLDDLDNERKRIDKFIIATNKTITVDARRFIEEATEGERRIIFLDLDRIITLVKEHRLMQYILFADLD